MHMYMSVKLASAILTSLITLDIPRIQKILKIFEPTIFPTAISLCPFRAETIEVTSSGIDVPIATIVRPMTLSDIPNICAILTAPSTNIFPHKNNPINHPMMRKIEIVIVCRFIPLSVFSSSLMIPAM